MLYFFSCESLVGHGIFGLRGAVRPVCAWRGHLCRAIYTFDSFRLSCLSQGPQTFVLRPAQPVAQHISFGGSIAPAPLAGFDLIGGVFFIQVGGKNLYEIEYPGPDHCSNRIEDALPPGISTGINEGDYESVYRSVCWTISRVMDLPTRPTGTTASHPPRVPPLLSFEIPK